MNCIVYLCGRNSAANRICIYSIYSAVKNTAVDCIFLTTADNSYLTFYKNLFPSIKIVFIDKYLNIFPNNNTAWEGNIVYCKFLIFKLDLFKKYKKILYLDIDTVVKQNLDNTIFKINTTAEILAAKDFFYGQGLYMLKQTCKKYNLTYNFLNYYNAGVILINYNKNSIIWNTFSTYLKYDFPYNEQDILNFMIVNRLDFEELPEKFNYMINNLRPPSNKQNIVICHYTNGGEKRENKLNEQTYLMQQISTDTDFLKKIKQIKLLKNYI